MNPLVSIIIPFYNCPYIEQAIVSALRQTYRRIEIIVVDDGSTIHADKIRPFMSRIRYLGKANGGTATALNHGIRMSSGQYIAWLSSDDMFYPDKVKKQVHFMLRHQSSLGFSAFDEIDSHNNVTGKHIAARYLNTSEFIRALATVNPINGCTVMLRRDLLSRIGTFNEDFPFTHDYELWLRAAANGVHMHFLDEPLTMYRVHGGMGTQRHWAAIQNEVAHLQAHYRPSLFAQAARFGG